MPALPVSDSDSRDRNRPVEPGRRLRAAGDTGLHCPRGRFVTPVSYLSPRSRQARSSTSPGRGRPTPATEPGEACSGAIVNSMSWSSGSGPRNEPADGDVTPVQRVAHLLFVINAVIRSPSTSMNRNCAAVGSAPFGWPAASRLANPTAPQIRQFRDPGTVVRHPTRVGAGVRLSLRIVLSPLCRSASLETVNRP